MDIRVDLKRKMISKKIANNPAHLSNMKRQFYKSTGMGGEDPVGDPVDIPDFSKPVKIYNNIKLPMIQMSSGVAAPEANKYIITEWDEGLAYGMQFDYEGKRYKVLNPEPEIRFGERVAWRAELRDISQGVSHAY